MTSSYFDGILLIEINQHLEILFFQNHIVIVWVSQYIDFKFFF